MWSIVRYSALNLTNPNENSKCVQVLGIQNYAGFLSFSCQNTVWKFHDFSITQILREIKFGDSRSAKYAISTHLETLNFGFYGLLHFKNLQN